MILKVDQGHLRWRNSVSHVSRFVSGR